MSLDMLQEPYVRLDALFRLTSANPAAVDLPEAPLSEFLGVTPWEARP